MTATIRNAAILSLYMIAIEDESVLQYPLPDRVFGFHAQQSCEKFLKSLFSAHSRPFPFTHSLRLLVERLQTECLEELPPLSYQFADLEPFAAELRYETSAHLTGADRAAIRQTVAILREFTLARILALQQP